MFFFHVNLNLRCHLSIENVKETKWHQDQVSKESRKLPTCFTTALGLKGLYRNQLWEIAEFDRAPGNLANQKKKKWLKWFREFGTLEAAFEDHLVRPVWGRGGTIGNMNHRATHSCLLYQHVPTSDTSVLASRHAVPLRKWDISETSGSVFCQYAEGRCVTCRRWMRRVGTRVSYADQKWLPFIWASQVFQGEVEVDRRIPLTVWNCLKKTDLCVSPFSCSAHILDYYQLSQLYFCALNLYF